MVTVVIDDKLFVSVMVTVFFVFLGCLIAYIWILKIDIEQLKEDKNILERIYQNKIEHLEEENTKLHKEIDYYNIRYTITGDVILPDGTVIPKETYERSINHVNS